MKIQSYDVALAAQSQFMRAEKSTVKVEVFEARQPSMNAVQLELSDSSKVDSSEDLYHMSEEDLAKIRLLEKMISAITGKEFKFKQYVKLEKAKPMNQGESQRGPKAFGLRIESSYEKMEAESMSFEAGGKVQTSDGRTIDFSMSLSMSRSYYERSEFAVEIGERLKDPLVINLDGQGIAFGEESIHMDLTLNGEVDVFKMLAQGSGFLALDKNENGTVDNGSELFGPSTGAGFDELAVYDEDGNNWIDESDEIFSSLKIWTVNSEGEKTLLGLKEAGVGAIFLGSVDSPYHIKENTSLVGKIRESGVYLKENGMAGSVHEIDLKI